VRLIIRLRQRHRAAALEPTGSPAATATSGDRGAPQTDPATGRPERKTAPDRGGDAADGGVQSHGQPSGDKVINPSRRLFLARSLAATAGAVAFGTAGAGAYFANSAPVVQRVPITPRGLDPAEAHGRTPRRSMMRSGASAPAEGDATTDSSQ
jgi:hypothetical protein